MLQSKQLLLRLLLLPLCLWDEVLASVKKASNWPADVPKIPPEPPVIQFQLLQEDPGGGGGGDPLPLYRYFIASLSIPFFLGVNGIWVYLTWFINRCLT